MATGYDCNFLSEPDDALKCPICLSIAREPRQHEECGKLFCNACIEKYGTHKPCPNCKKSGAQFYKDHRSKRDISNLEVECDSSKAKRRCTWVGTVGTLEAHSDVCEFSLVPCPKGCKDACGKVNQFARSVLTAHLEEDCQNRDFNCTHCGEKGTFASIQNHYKVCKKIEVYCPSIGCLKRMQRQHIQKHIDTDCPDAFVSCMYAYIGCKKRLQRRDMPPHEQDKEAHFNFALDSINKLSSQQVELKSGEPIKFKLTGYEMKKENGVRLDSPSYYMNGYHMAIRVCTNGSGDSSGTHLGVFAPVLAGRYDAELKWPLAGTVTITLLNQLRDRDHRLRVMELTPSMDVQVGRARGSNRFILLSDLDYDPVMKTQFLKNDTLYFRMSLIVADHKPWLE